MKQNDNQIKKVILLSDKAVKEQFELKDRALAATAEGITISDNTQPDNPIVYANEGFERLTGYPKEHVLGRNCRFLQGEDTNPKTVEEIREAVKEERACSVEILNYRKDGTTFWNLLSITPVRDASGRVTNFLGIQSDITKRKNYEESLSRLSAELMEKNERMKKDLEDARELQLAMLPTKLPKLPYLDIAVEMRTAQEVGGDYYDFHVDGDEMTFAIGDATGHGLKAGTIVTATKPLFNSFVRLTSPDEILNNMSVSLKEMGFRNMFMAMLIAKITEKKMVLSSAGMPFTRVYQAADKSAIEITLKGMPLGSFIDFKYETEEIELNKGDTFLFLSDGLVESFNPDGRQFGETRVRELFQRVARKSPEKIIKALTKAAEEWMGHPQPRDDMTLVVMKVK